MKAFCLAVFFGLFQVTQAQLFNDSTNVKLVIRGVNHIYNARPDTSSMYIDQVAMRLPGHPVVPMMKALNVLWSNIPVVTVDSVFETFDGHLREVIRAASAMDNGRREHPEAIFFEMSARGLLAEYYADAGHYMKALNEAGKAYDLIKAGFDLSDQVPDFLLTTGIYNYFREKYPEKYPIYKPFLWFFRGGDINLGLEQLSLASEKAVLTQVEAKVYLAYIYLRYEYEPVKAQSYLIDLTKKFPNNLYFKAKLLESLAPDDSFDEVPEGLIDALVASERPYYRMAGDAFRGLYLERIEKNDKEAIIHYRSGISAGSSIEGHGSYYRSLAYLGLGRIYLSRQNFREARYNLEKAMEISEAETIRNRAKKLLELI